MDKDDLRFGHRIFIYEDHIVPNGVLPREKAVESSAAWHFAKLAMQALDKVPQQATLEGQTDQTIRLRRIADSVAKLYDIKLEDMMAFMDFVKAEALRCGLFWNDRLSAWIASGGRAYDEVTREPEALNKQ